MPTNAQSEPKGSDFKDRQRFYQGRLYYEGRPASEQPVVLAVTKKLRRAASPAEAEITKDDLCHFAIVYPRLRLVPDKTRDRLEKWLETHGDVARGWGINDFWNTMDVDKSLGVSPEVCALPKGAKKRSEGDSDNDGDGDGDGDGGGDSDGDSDNDGGSDDDNDGDYDNRSARQPHRIRKHRGADNGDDRSNRQVCFPLPTPSVTTDIFSFFMLRTH